MARSPGGIQDGLDFCELGNIGVKDALWEHQAGEFALPNNQNQAGGFQFLEVVGEGSRRDGLALTKVGASGAVHFGGNLFEDLVAARVGERLGDELELLIGETL